MSNTGTLTDKGLSDRGVMVARIDDRPFDVLPHVLPFLDRIEKGARVEFQTKEGKISKVMRAPKEKTPEQMTKEREDYNRQAAGTPTGTPGETDIAGDAVEQAKRKAAGFGQPATGNNSETCTSPKETPAATLKTVEGQITTLDIPAHKIWLKDRKGETHYFIWGPALHDQMSKLKQWWFCKLTGEYEKDVDLWRLDSQEFFKRPEDWPFKPAGGNKGGFAPRNDKAIMLQVCYKETCEMARQFMVLSGEKPEMLNLEGLMDWAVNRAIKDAAMLTEKAGGA